MTTRYWLPAELRKELLYNIKGLDLIEQCHQELSSICEDESFWKSKNLYDYKIGYENAIYDAYKPYELYVLISYVTKYNPNFLHDPNNPAIIHPLGNEYVAEFGNALDGLAPTVFSDIDENKDAVDVYMNYPEIVLNTLNELDDNSYIKAYKYISENFPNYRLILSINDGIALYGGYLDKDNTKITLTLNELEDLLAAHRRGELRSALADLYQRQREEKEDPELRNYFRDLRRKAEREEPS